MEWRGEHLFVGRIWIGEVRRIVPIGWRDWPMYREPPLEGEPEHVTRNVAAMKKHHERHEAKPWRAWLSSDEDGSELGHYETEAEARCALEDVARKSMQP